MSRTANSGNAFRAFATCDDATLDKLMVQIGQTPKPRKTAKKKGR